MISKIGIGILRTLKEKENNYIKTNLIYSDDKESRFGSQCTYNELKSNFENYPFSSISSTLKFLLDEKYIMTNRAGKEYELDITLVNINNYRFIITDKGRYYLENLTYMKMSKYLPLSISVLSFVVSITGLIMQMIK